MADGSLPPLVHCVPWTVLSAVAVLEPALHQIAVYSPFRKAVKERCPGCTAVDHARNGIRGGLWGSTAFSTACSCVQQASQISAGRHILELKSVLLCCVTSNDIERMLKASIRHYI